MTKAYALGKLLLFVPALAGCSGSSAGAPAPTSAPLTIARVSLAFAQTPVVATGAAAMYPLTIRAFATDGTEIAGAYPENVTVSLDAACDFNIETSAGPINYVDPISINSTLCPNVSGPTPAPSVVVSAGGTYIAIAYNGGFVPSPITVSASATGVAAQTIALP